MAQKLLLIVGPTAVGKTTLAVELAQKQPEVLLKLIAQIEENNNLSILS